MAFAYFSEELQPGLRSYERRRHESADKWDQVRKEIDDRKRREEEERLKFVREMEVRIILFQADTRHVSSMTPSARSTVPLVRITILT